MKFDKANLRVERHEKHHRLKFLMPNNTGNYLHTNLQMTVNDALVCRQLLLDQEFYEQEVTLLEDDGYYRIFVKVKDVNGTEYEFHGRKLNLNDAIYERDELLE